VNPDDFLTGILRARRPETARGAVLSIDVPEALRAAYTRPGQYCRISVDGVVGHFALAGPPGPGPFEFYVQRRGAVADALLALPLEAPVGLTAPEGPGFPLAEALSGSGPIYVLGTGSGLAALHGVLAGVAAAGRTATVYAGCREPGDFVFLSDLRGWEAAGFGVHLLVSRRGDPGFAGRRGYVQHALAHDAPDLSAAWIFACGVPAMVEAVREVCLRLGADPARIRTNH
jgi:CDP-4-dehydro-6-deoxyglucose reductase